MAKRSTRRADQVVTPQDAETLVNLIDEAARSQAEDRQQARIRRLEVELQSERSRTKRILDDMNHMESRVELAEATYDPAREYAIGDKSKKSGSSCTAMVMLSDLHLEERVDPDVCMGNKYDLTIAKKRNDRVVNTMVDVLASSRKFYPWKDMVIWLGGDMISGAIHEELEACNFAGPAEAILFAQDMMLANIAKLRKELSPGKVTIICNMGNHGRTTHRKRFADGYNHSWEWLAYHNMARLFQQDKKVEFIIAKGSLVEVQISTMPIRFTHGDDVRYLGGVGGVYIPLMKWLANQDRRWKAHKTILGHYHQHFHINAAIMNGCLIGPNAYSIAGGFDAQCPSQTVGILDSHRGFIDVTQIFAE